MNKLFSISLILLTILWSCSSSDDSTDDNGGGGGGDPVIATYRITFTPNFTEASYPTDYPSNPSFSGILVAVHNSSKSVFNIGAPASAGLKTLAETGDSSALVSELQSQGGEDSVDFFVSTASSSGGPIESQTITVDIDPDKTSISFVSALSPSPDWFVGIDGVSLEASSNTLVETLNLALNALDAGTDNGDTYTAANEATTPQGTISTIVDPPLGNSGGVTRTIGNLTIERIDN